MRLGIRIFLVYFLFVGLAGYFLLNTVREQIRPVVRQSSEETLVDTANLLAEILRDDVKAGTLSQSRLPQVLKAYGSRSPGAQIWGLAKNQVSHRIYVTDAKGIVLLDSSGEALGKDYSQWNDVLLTLRGQYGARSTRSDPNDESTSVMHVGAPIIDDGKIIGVVTVAKPNSSLQPYIDRSERRLLTLGLGLIGLGLLIGAALSWWLARSLRRLARYAQAVSEGERAALPHYKGGELAHLAQAVERMRTQLEGKAYVERYVHTLTHELKSPLAAIRGGLASCCRTRACPPTSARVSPAISSARASACSRWSSACSTWPGSSRCRPWRMNSRWRWRRWWTSCCWLMGRGSKAPVCTCGSGCRRVCVCCVIRS